MAFENILNMVVAKVKGMRFNDSREIQKFLLSHLPDSTSVHGLVALEVRNYEDLMYMSRLVTKYTDIYEIIFKIIRDRQERFFVLSASVLIIDKTK